jgi:hypothetical protein
VTTVTVLTTAPVNLRKVERRLTQAGYVAAAEAGTVRISRHGRWDAVYTRVFNAARLPDRALQSATQLLGPAPRIAVECSFDDELGRSDAWTTAVDIARAIATEVPLAVLDDHAGTTYLVHPVRGLVSPEEYEAAQRQTPWNCLRRFFDA